MRMPTPGPDELRRWDQRYVWHPFTQMKEYLAGEPLTIVRGEGTRLMDAEGRWYYDGTSSLWLNVHGHRVPEIDEAVRAQLDLVAHTTLLGMGNVPSILLAKRLVELAPEGLTRVFYSECGASAVEIALKIAIQYQANRGRPAKKYVAGFTGNYHGDTLGAVGVARDELFHGAFLDLLPDHPRAPYPHCYRCPLGLARPECETACLGEIETLVREQAGRLAAIVFEPVLGAGGIVPAPPGWLAGLRRIAPEADVLLIVDEVATGMGRTGRLFACEAEGVTPDLLCLGKGLSGGYLPLAATLATDAIFDAFLGDPDERKTFFHGHSFTGNPLGCSAALASLDLFDELLPTLPAKAEHYRTLTARLNGKRFVGDVRTAGFMCGVELTADLEAKTPFRYGDRAGAVVTAIAREHGLLIRPIGNVVILMPPLAATEEELGDMVAILARSLTEAAPRLAELAERA